MLSASSIFQNMRQNEYVPYRYRQTQEERQTGKRSPFFYTGIRIFCSVAIFLAIVYCNEKNISFGKVDFNQIYQMITKTLV